MKLASYEWRGKPAYGVVIADHVYDLGAEGGSIEGDLARGLDWIRERAAGVTGGGPGGTPLAEVSFLPVVPRPAKIICIGLNYADHREEASREASAYPSVFFRYADTQIGHEQSAIKPATTGMFDYEGELAVVIGKPCRAVPEQDAMRVVAGYSCYNDLSARDWQQHTSQWGPGKNFPGTGGFGPWLVTVDEVPDPSALHLTTRVNGEQRQSASVSTLIFSIPALISYVTSFTALEPGDVLVTGTPAGVGLFREPPSFLNAGDQVEVEISGIGTLRNVVAAAAGS
jgi:2-keto-4-pentenoate hydratase/2-oxohepta-3-ene-1,7-dioic acid hydratase in catechol pathway